MKDYQKEGALQVKKVSGRMHSNAFKRRLAFSFTVIISALNNFLLLLKTKVLEYKPLLSLKNNLCALLRIS